MPLYCWHDKAKDKQLDVLRSFDDYKVPPTDEEAKKAGWTDEEIKKAIWTKLIGSGIQVTRGDNWNGSKGNW